MKKYIKLLRVKHYIKNLLVFIPLFFEGDFFDLFKISNACLGALAFCAISSAVYILNDLQDIEKDRRHPTKKLRPIASGEISKPQAKLFFIICLTFSIAITLFTDHIEGLVFILLYLLLNILYSYGMKNKPLIDILILSSGFVIRLFYGAALTNTQISGWLYLVIVTGSLYMGLGKRRNEMKAQKETREVLKYYTYSFLDKNMYTCATLVNVFYSLWTMEASNEQLKWTIPIFFLILMKYSLDIEGNSDGDPVEVVLHDNILMMLVAGYGICIFCLLYIF